MKKALPSGARYWRSKMGDVKASVWDYDTGKRVNWDSQTTHCSSCAWDETYGSFMDDPCCCAHLLEYEMKKRNGDFEEPKP